ncbi:hypothetical protein KA005_00230 [bacterium]|nr:hypothetical protein [bacterium]
MKSTLRMLAFISIFCLLHPGIIHAGWVENEVPLMEGVGPNRPAVYGDKFVFNTGGGRGKGPGTKGTYLYDVITGDLEMLIPKGRNSAMSLFEENLVFKKGRGIVLFDIYDKKGRVIGRGDSPPDIYSDWVVYKEVQNKKDFIVLYNMKTKEKKEIRLTGKMVSPYGVGPSIFENEVVWIEKKKKGGSGELMSYKIGEEKPRKRVTLTPGMIRSVQTLKYREGFVLMNTKKDVFICDMKEDTFRKISKSNNDIWLTMINGGKVVWSHSGRETLVIYDIAGDKYTKLKAKKGSSIYSAMVFGDKIFFVDHKAYELRMFEFVEE